MESPTGENKETESSLGDDFEKLEEENISYMENDHKEQLGDDFDIIGEIDEQHFEVLDSAGEAEGDAFNPPSTKGSLSDKATANADEGVLCICASVLGLVAV